MQTIKQLFTKLKLDPHGVTQCAADKFFPLKVTPDFVSRMQVGNWRDPLLRQILPLIVEQQKIAGFVNDPLQEKDATPVPGLLHKYHGRVLLLVTNVCALHCRYCFRRFSRDKIKQWAKVFAYIKNDATIKEVILSGGDPLVLSDARLSAIMHKLAAIPQIQRVRIHTRLPIVRPQRVTAHLVKALTATRLPVVLVTHVNHPNELDAAVARAIKRLRRADIVVLNQSVLLQGVNDSAAVLIALSEKLFAAGILPYYLHQLDKVQGAAHFWVAPKLAKQIYREMQQQLPGYLVPKLVYEKPGVGAKVGL